MKLNELTKQLYAEGYAKENPPDYVRPFNEFYGGFTYKPDYLRGLVFETPCGLLLKGSYFVSGSMSYMGVDWMPENNNPTVPCPRFSREPCMLNHELLRESRLNGEIVHCNCHLTDRPYDYGQSFDKAHDDVWKEADGLFKLFAMEKQGRVCRMQSRYNRLEKKWRAFYDPIVCAINGFCQYCDVLQAELSPLKGNVFYDLKITHTEKGEGLFPDKLKTKVIKGKKLLESTASMTICEAIVQYAKHRIQQKEEDKVSWQQHFDPGYAVEVLNVRAERRETRDMLQDLRDVAEGIEVVHAGDLTKAAAQKKRERRTQRQERRIAQLERLIIENGLNGLETIDQSRARKHLGPERIRELVREHRLRPDLKQEEPAQLSLF